MKSSSKLLFILSILSMCCLLNIQAINNPIEKCPDCTKSPQIYDATPEINQLAQTLHSFAQQNHQSPCSCINGTSCQSNNCSCTQNQCNCNVNSAIDDKLQNTVLNNFSNLIQSFIRILQNPKNNHVICSNLAKMIVGIVNVAKEVIHKLPKSMSMQEKELYLEELETTLNNSVRSLQNVRNQLNSAQNS